MDLIPVGGRCSEYRPPPDYDMLIQEYNSEQDTSHAIFFPDADPFGHHRLFAIGTGRLQPLGRGRTAIRPANAVFV